MNALATEGTKSTNTEEKFIRHTALKLEKKLTQGSFGMVYQGPWRMTNDPIKEFIPERLTAEEFGSEACTMKHRTILIL